MFRGDNEDVLVKDADVVFLKGILVLYNPKVRELLDILIFIDYDSDARLSKRGKMPLICTDASALHDLMMHLCSPAGPQPRARAAEDHLLLSLLQQAWL